MGEYSKALSSYEKSLEIRQQSLPPNHPDLAASYNNIGIVYSNMGEYSKALSSLEIRKMSYNNIGSVYGLEIEKSHAIRQQSLPPNHPDLAASYMGIGNVYTTWVNIPKHFRITKNHLKLNNNHFLQIILIWLLPTWASVMCITTWVNIPKHFRITKNHLKLNNKLPPNHPDLALSCYNIGLLYDKMDNYSKALSFSERAVNIGQQSLPPNHPDFKDYRKNSKE